MSISTEAVAPAPAARAAAGYEVAPAAGLSWRDLNPVVELAYGSFSTPDQLLESSAEVFEPERSYVVRRGTELCATLAVYSLSMTLPGGPQPVAGIGYVTVSPAHRRRGLMRAMIQRTLTDLHEAGAEPLAMLNSTEVPLYGRFGFGPASRHLQLTIGRSAQALTSPPEPNLAPSFHAAPDCFDAIARIYRAASAERPGLFARNAAWQRRAMLDPAEDRGSASPLRCLLLADGDGPRAYALYAVQPGWHDGSAAHVVQVRELFAADPAAYREIWRVLLDLDLTASVVASRRPLDDPLLALLTDARAAVPVVQDELSVRVVDLPAALTRRTYAAEVNTVLEIADPLCPWNAGRWRLDAGPDGASCVRDRAAADLSMSVRELGSTMLGDAPLVQSAAAGLVAEHTPGAAAALARALTHDRAPFCAMVF